MTRGVGSGALGGSKAEAEEINGTCWEMIRGSGGRDGVRVKYLGPGGKFGQCFRPTVGWMNEWA